MNKIPICPICDSKYTYEDGHLIICPECSYEWIPVSESEEIEELKDEKIYRDAHGAQLKDGDSVTVVKDLKIKGSSEVIKRGTNIKDIKLKDGDHDVDCRVPGIGNMELKSEFLKKI